MHLTTITQQDSASIKSNHSYTHASSQPITTPKLINDPIHGHIELNPILFRIIDTPQFQRLRELHQLGTAHLVFPGAAHTRFEHSIGVCYLAGKLMRHIQYYQPELVTEHDILIVQIAGLCHDLGHGPFSHIFDGEFLPQVWARHNTNNNIKHKKWTHEIGSIMLLDQLYNDNVHSIQDCITRADLELIKSLIIPSNSGVPLTDKLFLYEIVSNTRNGVDVDKFDYLLRDSFYTKIGFSNNFQSDRLIKSIRVIDNEICYNMKDSMNLYELFSTRYKLHKMCYSHRVCKAVEYMVVDIMIAAEPIFHYSQQIHNPIKYLYLTDNIISYIEQCEDTRLDTAKQLIYRLKIRKLYKMAIELTLPHSDKTLVRTITTLDILDHDQSKLLNAHDVIVQNLKLNYALNEKNPVKHVHFYHKHNMNKKFVIQKEEASILIPSVFQEVVIRVFLRDPTNEKIIAARAALNKLFDRHNSNEYSDNDDNDINHIDDNESVDTQPITHELDNNITNELNDNKRQISPSSTIISLQHKRTRYTPHIYRGGSTGVALLDVNDIPAHLLRSSRTNDTDDDELNKSSIYPTPTKPKPTHKFTNQPYAESQP